MDFPICRASITLIRSARDNPRRVLGAVGGFCVGAAIASEAVATICVTLQPPSRCLWPRRPSHGTRCCTPVCWSVQTVTDCRGPRVWVAPQTRWVKVGEIGERCYRWVVKYTRASGSWLKNTTMWCIITGKPTSRSMNWNTKLLNITIRLTTFLFFHTQPQTMTWNTL